MLDLATLKGILGAGELATKIAKLAGLIESVEGKLDLLLETPLNAGLHMLGDARDSGSEQERCRLLETARTKFYEAAQLEKSNIYRKILALVALSACHAWLDKKSTANRDKTLGMVLHCNPLLESTFVPRRAISDKAREDKQFESIKAGCLGFFAFGFVMCGVFFVVGFKGNGIVNSYPIMWIPLVGAPILAGMWWARRKPRTPEQAREALRIDRDLRKIAKLQLVVAEFLGEPVPWMRAAGIEASDPALRSL